MFPITRELVIQRPILRGLLVGLSSAKGFQKFSLLLNVQRNRIVKGKYHVDPDISKAETLPASFYRDPSVFETIKEKVFLKSWHWIGDTSMVSGANNTLPFQLFPGFLDEPMLLTRSRDDAFHCMSNVCTHRGNLVVSGAGLHKKLICGYHGRRFNLEGKFEHMPEFQETQDFPRPCDHLHAFPLKQWGPFLFAGLEPGFDLEPALEAMHERIGFMSLDAFKLDSSRSKTYQVKANWALYCDNYLEGFHIPFVHQDLNAVLDYGSYETVLFPHINVQIGYAEEGESVFEFPEGHIDYGKDIAAYYFWLFPNMMFNFYPWGLSLNLVEPQGIQNTQVKFLTYVYDASKLDTGAGSGLDKVELEDEEVVEGVQQGIKSRFYHTGRFSPKREQGVHHFHSLLSDFLNA